MVPEQPEDCFSRDEIAAALRSYRALIAGESAYDGDEVIAYLRAIGRGENPAKPQPQSMNFSGFSRRI
jgi:hypothetical protein